MGQTLNFGLPAPIDVMISGPNRNQDKDFELAAQIKDRIEKVAGATDVHVHQVRDVPLMKIDIDRTRANQLGFSQRDVAQSMLISLSGSAQSGANYWLSPGARIDYNVAVQTPTYNMDTPQAILNTPVHPTAGSSNAQMLSNMATVERGLTPGVVNHYNVQPTVDVYAGICRTETWAEWRRTSIRSLTNSGLNCRRAARWICEGKCRRCGPRLRAWAMA